LKGISVAHRVLAAVSGGRLGGKVMGQLSGLEA
jgi:hypothetical protein